LFISLHTRSTIYLPLSFRHAVFIFS
jgi:hypothetical protein